MKKYFSIILLFLLVSPTYAGQVYVIEQGDTLYGIAQEYGLTWQRLSEYNDIDEPSRILPGTFLRIPVEKEPFSASSDEITLLAKIIYAEARGESFEGQVAVGAVVINRVRSDLFPNSIAEVIYEPGQFTPAEMDKLPKNPNKLAYKAAEKALAGEDPSGGALFFYNPKTSRFMEYWETRPVIQTIGNHNFAI